VRARRSRPQGALDTKNLQPEACCLRLAAAGRAWCFGGKKPRQGHPATGRERLTGEIKEAGELRPKDEVHLGSRYNCLRGSLSL
jgi:hypothetical protein